MDLDVQRRERDTGVCRTQRLDDQVVDGDAARQQPGCVADRVRLQPGVEDTAFNLGGIGGERVLTTEVAVVPPVEYWCLGVKQGYLRLVRPVAFTAINCNLEGEVVQQGSWSEVEEEVGIGHSAAIWIGSRCSEGDPTGVIAAPGAPGLGGGAAVVALAVEMTRSHRRPWQHYHQHDQQQG